MRSGGLCHDSSCSRCRHHHGGAFPKLGHGQLFVNAETLPAGPFLGYDRNGELVNTTYMIPLSVMTPDMKLTDLAVPAGSVDHVDITYNAGHPGVSEPHIHITLWHVPADQENRVAK